MTASAIALNIAAGIPHTPWRCPSNLYEIKADSQYQEYTLLVLVTLTWTVLPGDRVTFIGETLNTLGS